MGYRQTVDAFDRRLRRDSPPGGMPILLLLGLVAILLRTISLGYISGDFVLDISRWQRALHEQGVAGIGGTFYNYNPPYIYLLFLGTLLPLPDLYTVKLISIIFDVILAVGVGRLVMFVKPNLYYGFLAALLTLLLPEVWLNSAVWGQIDAGYTSLIVWMLVAFLSRRGKTGWLLFGFAFAFKAQAVFILPLALLLFFHYRQRLWYPLLAIVAFVLADLPALLAGRSPVSLLNIYVKQADTYHRLSSNAPNFYLLINDRFFDTVRPVGLVVAAVTTLVLFLLCLWKTSRSQPGFDLNQPLTVLRLGLLFSLLIPFLLPQMHERYFYIPAVLALLIALFDRRFLPVAVMLQVANCCAYVPFLFGTVIGQVPYWPQLTWFVYVGLPFMVAAVIATIVLVFIKPLPSPVIGAPKVPKRDINV